MRVLVKCPDCQRRYNASPVKIGAKFRCLCGRVLTVKAPKGHDAAVVRCSSCGGLREDGSLRCAFCNADFTIHERDLNTVCPTCLARVSDRARFCSQCGSPLSADVVAGDVSKLDCPSCDKKVVLTNRIIQDAQVSFLECRMCAGLWMEPANFEALRKKHKESAVPLAAIDSAPRFQQESPEKQAKIRYRKCPVCHEFMNRRLYAAGSGVIIDWCRDHGVWFDDGELRQILDWIRQGGDAKRIEREPHRKNKAEAIAAAHQIMNGSNRRSRGTFFDHIFSGLQNAIDDLFDV